VTRILLRAHKSHFHSATPAETIIHRLIGSNAGNLMFSYAAERLLSTSDTEVEVSKFERFNPGYINEHYDVAVVPLANAFRLTMIDGLRDMSKLFEKLTIPIVILGVGAQGPTSGKFRPSALDAEVVRFMKAVLNRSPSVGVRGELTANYLARLGFGDEHVEVIGCPSMFQRGSDLQIARKVDRLTTYSNISLSVSPYRAEMGPISVDHALRYPNLTYTAQDQPTLGLMLTGTYRAPFTPPADTPTTLDHPLIRDNRVRFCLDPTTWMEYLSTFEFAFGTRIHGTIAAVMAGTPGLLLAHDSRTLELADYHRIPYRMLTKDTPVDAVELYEQADWDPMVEAHAERWDRMQSFLAAHQLRHVFEPGESPAAFDAKIAAVDFPPPIQMGMRHDLKSYYQLRHTTPALAFQMLRVKAKLPTKPGKNPSALRRFLSRMKAAVIPAR
jgi:hypothetical protein